MQEKRKNILELVRTLHRPRELLFSLIFGLSVIGTFYALRGVISPEFSRAEEMISALFIIVSMLLLFPAREKIVRMIFNREDYSSFFGQDFHHLDFIARQFTMDSLIQKIMPEMLEWLRVERGRLAVLEPDRRHFISYSFYKGKMVQDNTFQYQIFEKSVKYLKKNSRLAERSDPAIPEALRSLMGELDAEILQPIVYRNRFLGFIILHECPPHKYAAIGLETFANKAAVSIQNYILSMKVIDSEQFEQELLMASRIQRLLQTTKTPILPGYNVQQREHDFFPCVIEFFKTKNDEYFLAILCSLRPTGASGILLFGILGYLYSYIRRRDKFGIRSLMRHLKQDRDLAHSEYRVSILTAELRPDEQNMTVLADGEAFEIRQGDLREEDVRQSPLDGRAKIISLNEPLLISFEGVPLLEITPGTESLNQPSGARRKFRSKKKVRAYS